MANLSDLKQDKNLKILVFGESGSGKTVFATSFPGKIFVHDFDKKLISAANHLRANNPEQLNQIEYQDYSNIVAKGTDLEEIDEATTKARFAFFNTWLIQQQEAVRAGKFAYQTVVLDSLTLWAELLLKEVIRQAKGKIAQPIKNMEGNAGMQHYQLNQRFFKAYLHQLLDLPCNVVITAHIEIDKDETTGEIIRRPKATGQLSQYLPIIFGEVYRAYVEPGMNKTSYRLQTRSDGKYHCRTQLSKIPGVIDSSYSNLAL